MKQEHRAWPCKGPQCWPSSTVIGGSGGEWGDGGGEGGGGEGRGDGGEAGGGDGGDEGGGDAGGARGGGVVGGAIGKGGGAGGAIPNCIEATPCAQSHPSSSAASQHLLEPAQAVALP